MTNQASLEHHRLPRAVQAQMQRVQERLDAKAAAGAAPTPPNADGTPAADPPADPLNPAPPAPPSDPRENDPVYWKQRFKVTEGMLRRAREEADAALADKDRQLDELREQLRTLQARGTSHNDKPDVSLFFSQEQIDKFGVEQCEAMASVAIKAAQTKVQELSDTELRPIKDRTKASREQELQAKERAFWDKLAELVPDYEAINASDDWLTWLAEADEDSGLVRQDILNAHRNKHDAAGVAKVFMRFKKGKDRPTPPVAPSARSAAAAPPPPAAAQAKGYPTRDEIREFYKRAKFGKVSDQERKEFEARLASKAAA